MKIGESNKSPFSYPIKKLKPNMKYTMKIVRTKIGNGEGDSERGGEVVEFVETIKTMTIGKSAYILKSENNKTLKLYSGKLLLLSQRYLQKKIFYIFFFFSAETMSTSVESARVKHNTWNSSEIEIILHPELSGREMTYILISKELHSPNPPKIIPWENSRNTKLDFEIKRLQEDTWYYFDIELKDKGSLKSGPKMKKALIWKTKGSYFLIIYNINNSLEWTLVQ